MTHGTRRGDLEGAADAVFRTSASAFRHAILDAAGVSSEISAVVGDAHQFTDHAVHTVTESRPVGERPVCCLGCTACCHLHVVATPPEVIAIASYVNQHYSRENREQLLNRIETHVAVTDGLTATERQKIRPVCPLLVEGRCSVYPARPISCRGWNSLDRSVCDADLAAPSSGTTARLDLAQYVLAGRVAEGIAAASDGMGLESRPLDLVRGLSMALADAEGVARAWRSGEPVFAPAENSAVFPAPHDPLEEAARARLWNSLKDNPQT